MSYGIGIQPNPWVFDKLRMEAERKRQQEMERKVRAEREAARQSGCLCGCCWPTMWCLGCRKCCKTERRRTCTPCCVRCCDCCCEPEEEETVVKEEVAETRLGFEVIHIPHLYTENTLYDSAGDLAADILIHAVFNFMRASGKAVPKVTNVKEYLREYDANFTTTRYEGYGSILKRGDPTLGLYCIIDGQVQLTVHNELNKDKHKKIIRLSRGDYFGDAEIVLGLSESEFEVNAYKSCTITLIPHLALTDPYQRSTKFNHLSWYTSRRFPFAPNTKDEPSDITGSTHEFREVNPAPVEEPCMVEVVYSVPTAPYVMRWWIDKSVPHESTLNIRQTGYISKYEELLFLSVLKQTYLFADWSDRDLISLLPKLQENPFRVFSGDTIATTSDTMGRTDKLVIVYRGRLKIFNNNTGDSWVPDASFPIIFNEEAIFDPSWNPIYKVTALGPCFAIILPIKVVPAPGFSQIHHKLWGEKRRFYDVLRPTPYLPFALKEVSEVFLRLSRSFGLDYTKDIQKYVRGGASTFIKEHHYLTINCVQSSWILMICGKLRHIKRKDLDLENPEFQPIQEFTAPTLIKKQPVSNGSEFFLYAITDVLCIMVSDIPNVPMDDD